MTGFLVRGKAPLRGSIRMPSDLCIGQEALLWAALAEGPSTLRGMSPRSEHRALMAALRELGVAVAETPDAVHVMGVGLAGLKLPRGALDAADSPSTLEILSALLAGQRFGTRIEARGQARTHSLRTLLPPLRARGAQIAGTSNDEGALTAPVAVAPLLEGEWLAPVEIEIPNGDATTKRGLLITGLFARGITAVQEGLLSRDHTERALLALGVPVDTLGPLTLLDTSEGAPRWAGFNWHVPGDFSLAAFVIAAALSLEGSDVRIEGVTLNRSRTALFDALRATGARIEVTPKGTAAGDEPFGDVRVRASQLSAVRAAGELAARLAHDAPAFAALCAASRTRVSARDLGALRLQPEDPLKASLRVLRAFGAECTEYEDGFDAERGAGLVGAHVTADEAPSVRLLGLTLGLCAEGATTIDDAEALSALYPGLREGLVGLGADIATDIATV